MGRLGGVGIILWLGHIIMEGLRLDFGIWGGIPLFWAVAPIRALTGVDVGKFWIGFGGEGS